MHNNLVFTVVIVCMHNNLVFTVVLLLFQAHFASFIADIPECVAELKRQVALGRIKSFGICNFGPKNLKALFEGGCTPVSHQVSC